VVHIQGHALDRTHNPLEGKARPVGIVDQLEGKARAVGLGDQLEGKARAVGMRQLVDVAPAVGIEYQLMNVASLVAFDKARIHGSPELSTVLGGKMLQVETRNFRFHALGNMKMLEDKARLVFGSNGQLESVDSAFCGNTQPGSKVPASDNVFETKIHLLQFGLMAAIGGNVMGIEAHILQLKRDAPVAFTDTMLWIIAAIMVICCVEDVLNVVDHLPLLFVATYSLAFRTMIENGESHLVQVKTGASGCGRGTRRSGTGGDPPHDPR
jgi:hypothetical protein